MRACDDPFGSDGKRLPSANAAGPHASGLTFSALAQIAAVIAGAALTLLWMGRVPICTCGAVKLWHGAVQSAENSQHLTDWYAFTHLSHGFLFYAGLWLVSAATGWRHGLGVRLVVATLLEAGWEIVENTDFVINRYREATIALDYYGDSVVNSVADMVTMVAGFIFASRAPAWATALTALAIEAVLAYAIRDNLTLNIIMLIYPLDAIKAWQTGA